MDKISFSSRIRPVSAKEFSKVVSAIDHKNSVNFPWTIRESVHAGQAYTRRVCDCSVLGIIDGQDVLMLHLCPTHEDNKNYFEIRRFIAQGIDLKNPDLQAILIGSKNSKCSQNLYDKLAGFMQECDIPFSELKSTSDNCTIDVAYSSQKDEWIITGNKIDKLVRSGVNTSLEILKNVFKKVRISDCDEIV